MRTINFTPKGICARQINVVLDDNDVIQDVEFIGGCDGNHKGIVALCKGKKAKDVADVLSGISCGGRPTSCPDQLAQALKN
ncbi:MAG: TIGR03905 family TSCPD domain-containing protein [Sphaerochaetaceae bacterium]|nr:TIGR03905 family TSCPD domain-containing protein [Sphaerochaetaceae bacterium]